MSVCSSYIRGNLNFRFFNVKLIYNTWLIPIQEDITWALIKQYLETMLTIVPYEPKYNQNFRDLNIAWINEYFKVEKKDRELLNDPQSSIIAKGGYIFIGLWYNKPVGCFALIKKEIDRYELGKMAVNKSHHGLKIGQSMLAYAIDVARTENWKTLELYSSTKLDAALHIYKKFGFKEVSLEDNLEYLRSDVKMELTLLNVT